MPTMSQAFYCNVMSKLIH